MRIPSKPDRGDDVKPSQPTTDRPLMPNGYGVPEGTDGLLEWVRVEDRLVASIHYWMATTRPDGRPHVVPRWGVWLDGALWYDGSPETVHARNLRTNPACVLHLEDGRSSVIVEGIAAPADPPGLDLGGRIAAAIGAKYRERGYAPDADAWEGPDAGGLLRFSPVTAIAWFDFPTDVTRFTFERPRQ
jgi:hypothetical protein